MLKRTNIVIFFLFALLMQHFAFGQSNEGKRFWFGFMEHRDINSNTMVAMITSKQNTGGVISLPHLDWSETFTIGANNVTIIQLPASAETLGSETKNNTGILITTQQPSSVYIHQYYNARSEAAMVLPESSLGSEYFVMTYRGVVNQQVIYPSEFLVVATKNETEIFITVSDYTKAGRSPGNTFSILLDAGETFQVQAKNGDGDLTGSFMTGDKDFAVLGGNRWTEVPNGCGARDNILEQMYPVSTWGKQFVTVPNDRVDYDIFRILASEDNTVVDIQGATVTNSYTLNSGQFVEYQKSEATYILASNPILVAQFNVGIKCNGLGNMGDPSMVLLNSVEQTRDTVTLYSSSLENIYENFINIIAKSTDKENVRLDGQKLSDMGVTFGTIGPNDAFAYARVQVSTGAHTIISEGCGLIATAYGYGDYESYAYSGGASFSEINANPIPEGGCLNDTILFDTGLSPKRFSFSWDLGGGTTSTEASFTHIFRELGSYPIELIIVDHCLDVTDTIYRDLKVTLRQAVDALDSVLTCEGSPFQLAATDVADARYEWNGPKGYFSEQQFPSITSATPDMTGNYSVVGIVSGCATFPAYTDVNIIPTPEPYLGEDTLFCLRDQLSLTLNPGIFHTYHWQDFSTNATFEVTEEGTYSVHVIDEHGCFGEDEVVLWEQCPTQIYIPNVFSPNDDGNNDFFSAYGTDIISLQISIFDRWGTKIFHAANPDDHWNGYYKGELSPVGVYVWVIQYEGYREDGSVYSDILEGSVTLMR